MKVTLREDVGKRPLEDRMDDLRESIKGNVLTALLRLLSAKSVDSLGEKQKKDKSLHPIALFFLDKALKKVDVSLSAIRFDIRYEGGGPQCVVQVNNVKASSVAEVDDKVLFSGAIMGVTAEMVEEGTESEPVITIERSTSVRETEYTHSSANGERNSSELETSDAKSDINDTAV